MKRKKSDEIDAALRADPDYQDLCKLLDKQTGAQKERLEKRLAGEEKGGSMKTREDVDRRIVALKGQGLSFAKIAEFLNQQGHKTSTGGSFKKSSVQTRYEIIKRGRDRAGSSESLGQSSSAVIPAEWIDPLRLLIKEEIKTVSPSHDIAMDNPPPTPRKKGSKEYQGERGTLPGCRVDKILFNRFEQERKKLGVSASELMQRILWNAFNKPTLSFEIHAKIGK